jgi:hypothetical protein
MAGFPGSSPGRGRIPGHLFVGPEFPLFFPPLQPWQMGPTNRIIFGIKMALPLFKLKIFSPISYQMLNKPGVFLVKT